MRLTRSAQTLVLTAALFPLSCDVPPAGPEPEPEIETTSGALSAHEPIASFGHGAVIQPDGNIIQRPTREFILQAQKYYIEALEAQATPAQKAPVAAAAAARGPAPVTGPKAIVENHRKLKDLLTAVRPADSARIEALNSFLANVGGVAAETTAAATVPEMRTTTSAAGQTYIDQCRASGVPTPPTWGTTGTSGWTNRGDLQPNFLGGWANVFTYESTSPRGICIALPRYTDSGRTSIDLLGIICMGADTSKACFWDNPNTTNIPSGQQFTMLQMKGGGDLIANGQGICSDCHSGENPFIVHRGSALDRGAALVPKGWVNPMVPASWPQNRRPGKNMQLAGPDGCLTSGCHSKADGRRFPEFNTAIGGWCTLARTRFVGFSMFGPDYHVNALNNACGLAPKAKSTKFGTVGKWHDHFGLTGQIPFTGDFNGDGRDDVVSHSFTGNYPAEVAISSGSSFGPFQVWANFFALDGETPSVGDYNGDGKDDVATFDLVNRAVYIGISSGTAFSNAQFWLGSFGATGMVPMSGDFNNDRKDDIIYFKHSGDDVYVGLSNGSAFNTPTRWHSGFGGGSEITRVGDVDGDGFDDVITFTRGTAADVHVALSNGSSFGTKTKWHDNFGNGSPEVAVADVNGDGFDDVINFTRGSSKDIFVGLSDGTKFATGVKWHDSYSGDGQRPRLGDVDGDNRADAVNFTQDANADVMVAKSTF